MQYKELTKPLPLPDTKEKRTDPKSLSKTYFSNSTQPQALWNQWTLPVQLTYIFMFSL